MSLSESDLNNFAQSQGLNMNSQAPNAGTTSVSDSDLQNFAKTHGMNFNSGSSIGTGNAISGWSAPTYQAPTQPTQQGPSIGGFVGNVFKSGANVIGGIANTVMHPIKTIENIGQIAAGGIQEIPGVSQLFDNISKGGAANPQLQANRQAFNNIINFYAQRYGGKDIGQVIQHIANTAYTDPVGMLLDVSTIAGGIGAVGDAVKGVSLAGEAGAAGLTAEETASLAANPEIASAGALGKGAQIGQGISDFGKAINPIGQATNLIGRGINAAIGEGKTLLPAADTTVSEAGARLGMSPEELPISSQVPGTAKLEGIAAGGTGGAQTIDNIKGAFGKVNDAVTNLTDTNLDPEESGTNLGESMKGYKENFTNTKNQVFEQAIKNLDEKGSQVFPDGAATRSVLEKQISDEWQIAKGEGNIKEVPIIPGDPDSGMTTQLQQTTLGKDLQKRLAALNAGDMNVSDFYKNSQALNVKSAAFKATGGNYGFYDRLQQAMRLDLDNTISNSPEIDPSIRTGLAQANQYYQQGTDLINTKLGSALLNHIDNPELLMTKVTPALKTMSVDDINAVMGTLGDENSQIIRTQVMQDIFDKSTGADGNIKVGSIGKQISKFVGGESKLQAILTPEQYQTLKDIQTVSDNMGAAGKTLAKAGSPALGAEDLINTVSKGGVIWSLLTGNIGKALEFASTSIGEKVLNTFLQSSLGRKVLTQGLTVSGMSAERIGSIIDLTTKGASIAQITKEINDSQN